MFDSGVLIQDECIVPWRIENFAAFRRHGFIPPEAGTRQSERGVPRGKVKSRNRVKRAGEAPARANAPIRQTRNQPAVKEVAAKALPSEP